MIFSHYTGRDPSWIIIALAFVTRYRCCTGKDPNNGTGSIFPLKCIMVIFTISFFYSSFLCSLRPFWSISVSGLLTHSSVQLLALRHIYLKISLFLIRHTHFCGHSPHKIFSWGILEGSPDVFWIANSTVLIIGLILLYGALLLRSRIEGTGWWRVFFRWGRERTPNE